MLRARLEEPARRARCGCCMSTFAIVLGVAFVAGSLIFTDTLSRSFNAIFASTRRRRRGPPRGRHHGRRRAVDSRTIPASWSPTSSRSPARPASTGNVSAVAASSSSARTARWSAAPGRPGFGVNWTDAPAGPASRASRSSAGTTPHGPDEVALDAGTADEAGYDDRRHGPRSSTSGAPAADRARRWSASSDFADGGSLNGATLTVFDTATAQDRSSSTARTSTPTSWVTAADGVSQEELRDAVAAVLPDGVEAVTGDDAADERRQRAAGGDLGFLTTFLLIFAGISLVVGVFLIVNTFSILVAQRSRELALLRALGASRRQVTRSVLLEAFVVGRARLHARARARLPARARASRRCSRLFGLDLAGQSLVVRAADRPRGVRRRRRRHHGRGLAARPGVPRGSRRSRRCATTSPCPSPRCAGGCVVGVALIVARRRRCSVPAVRSTCRAPAGWSARGILADAARRAAAEPGDRRGRSWSAARRAVRRGSSARSATSPARTPCATRAGPPPPPRALMIGLALAVHDGDPRHVGQGAASTSSIEENFVGDYVVSNVVGQGFSPAIADRDARGRRRRGPWSQRPLRAGRDRRRRPVRRRPSTPSTLDRAARARRARRATLADLETGPVLLAETLADGPRRSRSATSSSFEMPGGDETLTVAGVFDGQPGRRPPTSLVTFDTCAKAGLRAAQDNACCRRSAADGSARRAGPARGRGGRHLPTVTVKDQAGVRRRSSGSRSTSSCIIIYGLLGLALVIAVLGIVNTLACRSSSAPARSACCGRSGSAARQLRRMIRLESVVIAVLGALLGVVLGIVLRGRR